MISGAMIEYWNSPPDRRGADALPATCGRCMWLELKAIDSGLRQCRYRGLRWSWQERCDRTDVARAAVTLEQTLDRAIEIRQ